MKTFFYHKRFLVAILSFLAVIAIASPNLNAEAQSGSDFSVQLSPEFPGPYQTVTAKLVSYSIQLDRAAVSWTLNGKSALSGVGKKEFSFTTGGIGVSSRLTVRVTDIEGTVSKTITTVPGSVDLLWQASNAYVPPFYRGKALPAPESAIKIVAMPNLQSGGSALRATSLVYKWSRNYKAAEDASGYGKNVFSFKNSYLDPEESVEVEVAGMSGIGNAKGRISMAMMPPLVLFYENNPLQGILYEKSLGSSFGMPNNEIRVNAEPYFFSTSDKQANLNYSWQLNGNSVSGAPDDPSSLILREGGGNGTAQVALSVGAPKKILQTAGNSFIINFGR